MKKLILLSTMLIGATSVYAAGYQLQEYSVTGLGRSMAGVGVVGDDYSAIAFNPAGMGVNKTSGIQGALTAVSLRSRVKGSAVVGGKTKNGHDYTHIFRVLPSVFAQHNLNDKLSLGLGLYTPFGLATDYRNDWFASAQGQYSAITVVNLTPSISYKLVDSLTLGMGVNIQYATAHLTGATADGGFTDMKDADDYSVGYTVGLVFQPWKTTRLGVSYRSAVRHKLEGKNKMRGGIYTGFLTGTHDVSAKIVTPETVIFSAAQDVTDKWTLSGTARFTRWDRFHYLDIYQEKVGKLSSVHENWHNTWFFAAGADYKYCDNLTFRFGGAYDQTAIKSPAYRTVRIPDERRIWASIGATYQKNNWQVDVGYAHLFVRKAKTGAITGNAPLNVRVDSAYHHTQSDIVGLQLQYHF
ncbi:MAG: transporter [Alphaproteobacteria bacterium]|nr:transporter [Alphaproteobacteria bacterium]